MNIGKEIYLHIHRINCMFFKTCNAKSFISFDKSTQLGFPESRRHIYENSKGGLMFYCSMLSFRGRVVIHHNNNDTYTMYCIATNKDSLEFKNFKLEVSHFDLYKELDNIFNLRSQLDG